MSLQFHAYTVTLRHDADSDPPVRQGTCLGKSGGTGWHAMLRWDYYVVPQVSQTTFYQDVHSCTVDHNSLLQFASGGISLSQGHNSNIGAEENMLSIVTVHELTELYTVSTGSR